METGFESLWPKRWGSLVLMPQFLADPDRFKREMQNEPASGEGCFDPDNFTYWNKSGLSRQELLAPFGKEYKIVVAIDPATGKVNGDYSAIAVVAKHKEIYYVLQVLLLRDKTEALLDHIFAIVQQGAHAVVMEVNGGQDYLASQLESESIKRGIPIPLKRITQKSTKDMRVRGLTPFVNTGVLQFNIDDRVFLQQMREFPLGAHDDGPDALEMAVRTLMEMKNGMTAENVGMMIQLIKRANAPSYEGCSSVDSMLTRAMRGDFLGGQVYRRI